MRGESEYVKRARPGIQTDSERAERLANLLTLSYEPMLAWRLDGPIEFWNAGAEQLYGFSPDEAVGRSSHALLQTKFPIRFCRTSLAASQMNATGPVNCAIPARTAARSLSIAGCNCLATIPCLRSIATLPHERYSESVFNQSGIFAGIMDLHGYLRDANNLSLEWCGYTREQVLDRPFWETPWWRGSEEMKAKIRFATDQAAVRALSFEKSFDTGWPTAASASLTLRCIPSATDPAR